MLVVLFTSFLLHILITSIDTSLSTLRSTTIPMFSIISHIIKLTHAGFKKEATIERFSRDRDMQWYVKKKVALKGTHDMITHGGRSYRPSVSHQNFLLFYNPVAIFAKYVPYLVFSMICSLIHYSYPVLSPISALIPAPKMLLLSSFLIIFQRYCWVIE